jgi:flagellin
MALTINTNVASLNAQRNLTSTQGALETSLRRLSSGLRVNSAKDDAAGLFSIQKMTADIRGLNQAVRNLPTRLLKTAPGCRPRSTS